ncbi:MAG: nucleotidyltransferase domain-containing protein, partial [Candidatus Aenigmatarchaeota archaeon]
MPRKKTVKKTKKGTLDTPEQLDKEKSKRVQVLKKFTKEALKKYGPVIRSIVLFGSTARGGFKKHSDIDVFVIIDDTRTKITPIFREQLEDDLERIAKSCSKNMSVQQPYMLTEFWRLVREGHPIVFNFIREGVPVFDKDIFLPIKRLLQMGEIRPSQEAVEKFIERGPKRIKRVENAKMYMVVEDCYYAMLESAQAVLMFMGKIPPRPSDAAESLRKDVVKMKLVSEKYVQYLDDVITLRKKVEHKEIKS